jgi:hypothetical protein
MLVTRFLPETFQFSAAISDRCNAHASGAVNVVLVFQFSAAISDRCNNPRCSNPRRGRYFNSQRPFLTAATCRLRTGRTPEFLFQFSAAISDRCNLRALFALVSTVISILSGHF